MSGSFRPRMRLTLAATCQARRRRPPVPITRAPADACRRHTKTQPLHDADAMIVLRDIAYPGMQPRGILQATRNALTSHYGAARVCTGRRRPDRPCRPARTAHPIWVRRNYPPASLTYAMASPRTTTRAHSAITGTPTEGEQNARQKKPGIAPADAQMSCHDPDVPGKTSLPLAARCLAGR
jgi:hypothetical protein